MTTRQDPKEAVPAWEETVVIPTYPAPAPERLPMFLDKRVYQGSSGRVYPNPFTDRVSDTKIDRPYRAVFLENEFIRLMILPEIGGRIHIGQDKTNNYDFFYRQTVIKPALVGLLGPWISGGVEFNWPQHHRPSTFMPVHHSIEEHTDGSRTVWLSEHEPMNRMKGMVGICLHPRKALVEAKVRLYNRTPLMQTFLWWANAGIHVHDQYQAFFPPDVWFVADHAKRAMSRFPIARNFYYGVDYTAGVDLTWYRNIPVPTSYMVTRSDYDFFGGYDHAKRAGIVHVANRHIAPGKKLWTWGNAEFGYAWDRELTDSDGPYIELMAGVYTDNQPDFSWLQPFETKSFSQYWYPIQEIGPVKNANRKVAVNLERRDGNWRVGVCATEPLENLRVVVTAEDSAVFDQSASVSPGRPFLAEFAAPGSRQGAGLLLRIIDREGSELIRYRPHERRPDALPGPATEPPHPAEIPSADELYVTGLHLEQYRHATRSPELYWEEALRRDPLDARSNNALGLLALRRGEFAPAEQHFRNAVLRLTLRNPNPYDGESYYNLGLALKFQGRLEEAYAAFYKAVWNGAWQSPGYYALAEIDWSRGDWHTALEHLDRSLAVNTANLRARNLKCAALRALGCNKEALALARETSSLDRLDFWSQYELVQLSAPRRRRSLEASFFQRMGWDPQVCLDLAFDYAGAGFWNEAFAVLERYERAGERTGALYPIVLYALGYLCEKRGDGPETARRYYSEAAQAPPDYCFPAQLNELLVLEAALAANPGDARAHYYLGNLLYDKGRREEAIEHFQQACELDPEFYIPWRNLGIAWYNVRRDPARALACYEKACQVNPSDARLLYEIDQLRKRMGVSPESRLMELERHRDLVDQRDDLTIEFVTLLNQTGRSAEALALLNSRRFHPWEGGEGLVSGQYVAAHLILAREALETGGPEEALRHFEAARHYPRNLGEGKHLLTLETHVDYWTGVACQRLHMGGEAKTYFEAAAAARTGDTWVACYKALALRALGQEAEARTQLEHLAEFATQQMTAEVKIDYFATSLPNFLLFEDDLAKRQRIDCLYLRGLANLALGKRDKAAEDFRTVLDGDPSHLWARKELAWMEAAVTDTVHGS